jgi:hypothetical protein
MVTLYEFRRDKLVGSGRRFGDKRKLLQPLNPVFEIRDAHRIALGGHLASTQENQQSKAAYLVQNTIRQNVG